MLLYEDYDSILSNSISPIQPRIPDFGRRQPPGAIIVVVGAQVVKETSAQALHTFCG